MIRSRANIFRIILILIVSLGILGTLIYHSVQSFERFETLADKLNQRQNWQSELADHIIIDISELDRLSRTYQLSLSRKDLAPYLGKVEELKLEIDSLHRGSIGTAYHDEVDTLRQVFAEKVQNFEELILFKISQSELQDDISALELLADSRDEILTDSMLVPTREITTTTITTTNQDSLIKRGLFSRMFRSKDENTPNREMMQERTIAYDSMYFEKVDTMMATVESALRQAESQRRYEQRLLANRELQIASYDLLIIDKLKSIAAEIGRLNEELVHEQRVTAVREARTALDNVLFWVICGGLLTIFFTILVIRDIIIASKLQRELKLSTAKAESLANSREEFLANMSHELRTPLNSIIGFAGQIDTRENDTKEKLGHLRHSSEHLLSIVNDILDYSKIESGKLALERIGFKPMTVIRECYDMISYQAGQKGLEIRIETDAELEEALVLGDPLRLKQILINLTNNAIKFTENGYVKIVADLDERKNNELCLRISVEDTGIGIKSDKLEEIFESFQQEGGMSHPQHGGTGLGLAISKKLIEAQGGALKVESELGEGSSFSFSLIFPKADSDMYSGNFQPHTANISLKGSSLLLVDDDEMNHILLKPSFKKWQLDFDSAYNSEEALRFLKKKAYDYVLLDLNLPNRPGSDLIDDIRHTSSETRIILCTANPLIQKQQPELLTRVDELLLKPYKEYEVAAALSGSNDTSEDRIAAEPMPLYTLQNFSKFAGNDPQILRKFIRSFIDSNKQNLELLDQYMEAGDKLALADVAHKMKNTYGQLEAGEIMQRLLALENPLEKVSNKRKTTAIEEIKALSEQLFIQLEKELDQIS